MAYLSEHCAFAHLTEDLATRLQGFSCEQEPAIADFFRDEAVLNERQLLSKSYCFYLPDTMEAVCAFCVSNSNISTRTMPTDKTEKEYRGIYGRKPLRTRFMTYDLTLMKL